MATFTNTIVSCINNVRECLSHCAKAPCSRLLDSALEAALPLISSQGDGMAAVAYELEVRPWIALVSQNVFGVKSKFAPAVTAPVPGVHAVVANGSAPPAPSHSNSVADAADVSKQLPRAADAIAAAPTADPDASTVNAAALSNGGS
jgi:hypothetical protein